MSRPTRATPGGRAYLALRARARSEGRPTGDVDLLTRSIASEVDVIADVVRQILAVRADDGVTFDVDALRAEVIPDAELYAGVRFVVPASIDRARHPLRIDINVGDPVTPGPVEVDYPALLDESFTLLGSLATVLAEKIVTMVDRGDTITRDRDFAAVYVLFARHSIDAAELAAAIASTGSHRGSDLRPIRQTLIALRRRRQPEWSRFIARSGLVDSVPGRLSDAIDAVADFADPILSGEVVDGTWDPEARRWLPAD